MLVPLLTLSLALTGTSAATRPSPDIDPAWSPNGQYIAFARLREESSVDTSGHIWIVGRDGRSPREVTPDTDPTYYGQPQWSPDGAWLAIQDQSRYSAPSMAVVRTDGRNLTEIRTTSGSTTEALRAAWSPDGSRLALAGNSGIFLAEHDIWQAQFLALGAGYPSWSPDGSRIVMASGTLAVVAVDSGTLTNLPAPRALAAWAPDGTRIAYATGCRVGVVSAEARGNPPRQRSCGVNTTGSVPSWSPDGRRFTYSQCANAKCLVYVASAAHPSQATRIARGKDPKWSPDGRRIAYARVVGNRFVGIWLIYPNGAGARPLLEH